MVPEYSSSWTQEILFSHLHVPVTQRGGGGGVVLRISSGGIDRRIFGGLRFRNFFGQENLASIFWGG